MFRNHLRIAWRNLLKRKGYSALNIFGLAIGMSCCLLIFHYVAYEKSYDRFPPNADRIVRLRLDAYHQGKLMWQSATVYPAQLVGDAQLAPGLRLPHLDPMVGLRPRRPPRPGDRPPHRRHPGGASRSC